MYEVVISNHNTMEDNRLPKPRLIRVSVHRIVPVNITALH